MRMRCLAVRTVMCVIVFSAIIEPLWAKKDDGARLDDFKSLTAVKWDMNRKKIETLFGKHMPEGEILHHTRGFIAGKEAVMYFQFDRQTGKVIQTNMALPVGDLPEDEITGTFDALEADLIKKYGNPTHRMRGAGADKMFPGLLMYDAWARKNVEIILLLDTNQARLEQMVDVIKDEQLRQEIETWGNKRNAVIGVVFRKPGLVE